MDKKFDNIYENLQIGTGCFDMNISSVLEYNNMLSMSIAYSSTNLIYSPKTFTKFTKEINAEEYISKDNELLIVQGIDSKYHDDYFVYGENYCKNFNLFEIKILDEKIRYDLNELKNMYISQGIPLITTADHFYIHDIYKENGSNAFKYHSGNHCLTVLDITDNDCYITDKFFSYKGYINKDIYLEAVTSEYIKKAYCIIVNINEEYRNISEDERIRYLFKKSIQSFAEESTYIDGEKYYLNTFALEEMMRNLPIHTEELVKQKGKYAAQFLTKLITPIVVGTRGMGNLLTYLNMYLKSDIVDELQALYKTVGESWMLMAQLSIKSYRQKKTLTDYNDRLINVLREINKNENAIAKGLEKLKNQI